MDHASDSRTVHVSVTFQEGIDMDATSVRVAISGSGGQSGVTVTEVNEPQSINGSGGGKEVEKCARHDFPHGFEYVSNEFCYFPHGFEYLSNEKETMPTKVKACPHKWNKRGSNGCADRYSCKSCGLVCVQDRSTKGKRWHIKD